MSKFEEFLDEISELPLEVRRSIVAMKDLEQQRDELQNSNNRSAKQYLINLQKGKSTSQDKKSTLNEIRTNYDQMNALSKEKLELARKVFALAESNIRRIDRKIQGVEDKIKKKDKMPGISPKSKTIKKNKKSVVKACDYELSDEEDYQNYVEPKVLGKVQPVSYKENQKLLRGFGQPIQNFSTNLFRTPSTNLNKQSSINSEPLYCFCRSISYGDMIACDNSHCQFEWFHFACVGLTSKPEGKWFCPLCESKIAGKPLVGVQPERSPSRRRNK